MTNTELLREKIEESGYKLKFIAEHVGITYQGFLKKMKGESPFKVADVKALAELLNLTQEDINAIFFCIESR